MKISLNKNVLSSKNAELLTSAEAVISVLEGEGWLCSIMGGLPRDIQHGLDAKDADICVYGSKQFDMEDDACIELVERLEYLDDKVKVWSEVLLEQCAEDEEAEEIYQDLGRVSEVIHLPNLNVDIIFYSTGELIKSVSDRFDANINQFALINGSVRFLGEDYGTLKQIRVDLSPARIGKINRKAEICGWEGQLSGGSDD